MRHWIIAAAAALAACAAEEEANLSSIEGNAAETAQSLADNGTGASTNSGSQPALAGPSRWFERTDQRGAWAGYGPPSSEALFSVRCEGGRLIFSTTEVPRSGPGSTTMQLSATGVDQSLPAEASEEGLPNTEASVPGDAEWLSRLAAATGELSVRVGSGEPLAVSIGEPLTSLIRDCRP